MSMYDVFDELMKSRKMNPTEVSRQTKIPRSMFTDWKNGRSTPKADKLKTLADFFGVSVDVFYDDDVKVQNSGQQKVYYENAETAQLAQEMFEDRDMRALFNMKRNMDPDRFAIQMRAFRDMYRLEHPEEFPEDFND